MQVYLIEIEEYGGNRYEYPFGMYKSEETAMDFLKHFKCELYKHIEIKCVEISDTDILFEFLKFMQQGKQIPSYACNFQSFMKKLVRLFAPSL